MVSSLSLKNREFSYWEKDMLSRKREIIIIGAGLVGLSTAISLKEKDSSLDILVLERANIPYGASTRNAGFACFGSVSEILDDINNHGEATVSSLIKERWEGLIKLRERLSDQKLLYNQYGGYELFDESKKDLYQDCIDNIPFVNEIVYQATGLKDCFSTVDNSLFSALDKLVYNQYEGQLHPGQMIDGLIRKANDLGITFLYGAEVEDISSGSDSNNKINLKGEVQLSCDKLFITTNAFSNILVKDLDLSPGRNQVLITKPIEGLKIKGCYHYDKGFVYFRNVKNRLLIGGGRNIDDNENTDQFGLTFKIQDYLRSLLSNIILPNTPYQEDSWWSGIIATGSSKSPLVQKIGDNQYLGVRLSGMGVALGSLIGEKLANLGLD